MNPKLILLVGCALIVSCSKDSLPVGAATTPTVTAMAKPLIAPPMPLTLAAGTPLSVRLTTSVSSNVQVAGETFYGELVNPLVVRGVTLAPRGTQVIGIVSESSKGGRVKGLAHVSLRATQLKLDNGQVIGISTNSRMFQARKTVKRDAIAIGVTSGIGTAIGAITGKGKGAAIGAGAGAGAGTVGVLATRGVAAVVPAETLLSFSLSNPVSVPR